MIVGKQCGKRKDKDMNRLAMPPDRRLDFPPSTADFSPQPQSGSVD